MICPITFSHKRYTNTDIDPGVQSGSYLLMGQQCHLHLFANTDNKAYHGTIKLSPLQEAISREKESECGRLYSSFHPSSSSREGVFCTALCVVGRDMDSTVGHVGWTEIDYSVGLFGLRVFACDSLAET